MKKILAFLFLSLISSNLYAGSVTFDQLQASADLSTVKYNKDLNTIFIDYNSNVQTSNIKDGTLLVGDFDDSSNPQIRTNEGAACAFVYSGLLSTTTSGTLTGSISAGTAYPVGYRIAKSSPTAKTFTASKWTWVDLDFNGNFQYSEASIGGATPAVFANSIRLERVSTDGTQISTIQDLRKTSCATGPFSAIKDVSSEASLGDLLSFGSPYKKTGSNGWIQGSYVSRDQATTFVVKAGTALINGLYRGLSVDLTVPSTIAQPSTGVSGLDTGILTASTKYNVFLAADQSNATYSAIYSTSASPLGATNYRKISEIYTDANAQFTSADIVQVNNLSEQETAKAWVNFNGTSGALVVNRKYNVASVTRSGTGVYAVTFDHNMGNPFYSCLATATRTASVATDPAIASCYSLTASTVGITTEDENGAGADSANVNVLVFGEQT